MKLAKYKKQITAIMAVLVLFVCVNSAFAMYHPGTGRFTRMDPFTGVKENPQSLHKYNYCQNNPVNRIDPTGKASTYSLQEVSVTNAIQAQMQAAISVIGGYHIYQAAQDLDRTLLEREIKFFVQTHQAPGTFTQQEFQHLDNMLRIRNKGRNVNIYLHYGFRKDWLAGKFVGGMLPDSYVTKTVYPTGWIAKWFLALYRRGPRDAIFIVLPDKQVVGPSPVPKATDIKTGILLQGGGQQWHLPLGTSPGTVFEPIPIPEGSLSDVPSGR